MTGTVLADLHQDVRDDVAAAGSEAAGRRRAGPHDHAVAGPEEHLDQIAGARLVAAHLLVGIAAARRGTEVAVQAVAGEVEQQQVHHDLGAAADLLVEAEINQVEQRPEVFLVVGMSVPLREAETHAVGEPAKEARPGVAHPLFAGLVSRAGAVGSFGAERQSRPEDFVRQPLAGQVLGAREQQLMVLGPEGHLLGDVVFFDLLVDHALDLLGGERRPLRERLAAAHGPDHLLPILVIERAVDEERIVDPELEFEERFLEMGFHVSRKVDASVERLAIAPRRPGGAQVRRHFAGEIEQANQLGGLEVGGLLERFEMREGRGTDHIPESGLGCFERGHGLEIGRLGGGPAEQLHLPSRLGDREVEAGDRLKDVVALGAAGGSTHHRVVGQAIARHSWRRLEVEHVAGGVDRLLVPFQRHDDVAEPAFERQRIPRLLLRLRRVVSRTTHVPHLLCGRIVVPVHPAVIELEGIVLQVEMADQGLPVASTPARHLLLDGRLNRSAGRIRHRWTRRSRLRQM